MHYVTGHKNPDADSIAAALVYAWYLRETGMDSEAQAVRLGEPTPEAAFLLRHTGVESPALLAAFPEASQLHIVDTSNPAELHDLSGCTIHSIIDHHKLSGLTTSAPLRVHIDTVGCTSTLLAESILNAGLSLPASHATLLLGAIISDTIKFSSPTTTERDQKAAQWLAPLAGISIEDLAQQQFAAKSDLTGQSPEAIVTSDSKVFEMGNETLFIASHETADPTYALGMLDTLRTALSEHVRSNGFTGGLFFIVDIVKSEAHLITNNERIQEIAAKAYECTFTDGIAHLPGVVSRKAQMVPPLQQLLG